MIDVEKLFAWLFGSFFAYGVIFCFYNIGKAAAEMEIKRRKSASLFVEIRIIFQSALCLAAATAILCGGKFGSKESNTWAAFVFLVLFLPVTFGLIAGFKNHAAEAERPAADSL